MIEHKRYFLFVSILLSLDWIHRREIRLLPLSLARWFVNTLLWYWSTVTCLVVIWFPVVNVKQNWCKVKKDDLAETSGLNTSPIMHTNLTSNKIWNRQLLGQTNVHTVSTTRTRNTVWLEPEIQYDYNQKYSTTRTRNTVRL